jgi:hypothetical protein
MDVRRRWPILIEDPCRGYQAVFRGLAHAREARRKSDALRVILLQQKQTSGPKCISIDQVSNCNSQAQDGLAKWRWAIPGSEKLDNLRVGPGRPFVIFTCNTINF